MKPKRTHLELLSGAYLDYLDPQVQDIAFSDIATGLANTCRWVGQCPYHYSVAEHACLVHDIVEAWGGTPAQRFGALHHDDHEAYVGDVPTPLKQILGEAYRQLVERLDVVIADRLGCDPALFTDPLVKKADLLALFWEAERFKPSKGHHWEGRERIAEPGKPVRLPMAVRPLVGDAERHYVNRHRALAEALV
jgi:hypothetical protein